MTTATIITKLKELSKEVGCFKIGKIERILGEGNFGCTVYGSECKKVENKALIKIL